jgi:hypothetical protein
VILLVLEATKLDGVGRVELDVRVMDVVDEERDEDLELGWEMEEVSGGLVLV